MIFVFRRFGWLVARDRAALLPVSPVECPLETSKRGCSPYARRSRRASPTGVCCLRRKTTKGLDYWVGDAVTSRGQSGKT
jgi:hypothetical protein